MLDDGENTYLYGLVRIGEEQPSGWAYHHGDALGSVRQLTDGNGVVTLVKSYQPYGEVLSSVGDGETSYSYTGEWADASGLIFLRAGFYSPWDGRFLSRDVWEGDANQPMSYNGWLYGYGNPVMMTDPSGMNPSCQHPWPSYCAYIRALEIVDEEYPDGLDALIKLFEDDELYSIWGNVAGHTNKQRLLWILNVTSGSGGGGGPEYEPGIDWKNIPEEIKKVILSCGRIPFQFGIDFGGDESFAQEFRDHDFYRTVWGSPNHLSTQVQHFLNAVALTKINPWDWGLKLIIGHEKLSDRDSDEWQQFNATTEDDIRLWWLAVDADSRGDSSLRDALLWKILGFKSSVSFDYVDEKRVGNSLQDLRLSLRGYNFYNWIQQNQSDNPDSAARWLRFNLHKDSR